MQLTKARGSALDTIGRLGIENHHQLRIEPSRAEPVANRPRRSEKDGLIELRGNRIVQRVEHARLGPFPEDQPALA